MCVQLARTSSSMLSTLQHTTARALADVDSRFRNAHSVTASIEQQLVACNKKVGTDILYAIRISCMYALCVYHYVRPLCVCTPSVCMYALCVYVRPLCVCTPSVCMYALCVYVCPLCVSLCTPSVCMYALCVYVHPLCVCTPSVCMYALCVYVCPLCVCTPSVCMYALCVYVHPPCTDTSVCPPP